MINLDEIAQRFCGAILFDGEGNSTVVKTTECFDFEALRSIDVDEEEVYFEEVKGIDVSYFSLKDLPNNVADIDMIKAKFIREISTLSKTRRKLLLEQLKEVD